MMLPDTEIFHNKGAIFLVMGKRERARAQFRPRQAPLPANRGPIRCGRFRGGPPSDRMSASPSLFREQ